MKFNLDIYLENLDKIIQNILSTTDSKNLTYDILDNEISKQFKLAILEEKQYRMKIGQIWQEVIGTYDGYINLGNRSGIDIISYDKKIVIELKNRTNTDNYSSKYFNMNKLAEFKKHNPEYTCIYANINCNSEEETLVGFDKRVIYRDIEIKHKAGYNFLNFIFGTDTHVIINFVKSSISKHCFNTFTYCNS